MVDACSYSKFGNRNSYSHYLPTKDRYRRDANSVSSVMIMKRIKRLISIAMRKNLSLQICASFMTQNTSG
jgi:hypothetical protein